MEECRYDSCEGCRELVTGLTPRRREAERDTAMKISIPNLLSSS